MLKTIGLILGLAFVPVFGHEAPPAARSTEAAAPVYAVRDTLGALASGLR
jgi:hypothetical protein